MQKEAEKEEKIGTMLKDARGALCGLMYLFVPNSSDCWLPKDG